MPRNSSGRVRRIGREVIALAASAALVFGIVSPASANSDTGVGSTLVTTATAADLPPLPLEPIGVTGPMVFSSFQDFGQVNRNDAPPMSADGHYTALVVTETDPETEQSDEFLYRVDTTTGERVLVTDYLPDAPKRTSCVRLSGDGGTVVFTEWVRGLPVEVPEGIDDHFGLWAYHFDVDTATLTAFPMPDPSDALDAWDSEPCPRDISDDGSRVIFTMWGRLFLAEFGQGEPLVEHISVGASGERVRSAQMDATGERVVAHSVETVSPYSYSLRAIDIRATAAELWNTGLGSRSLDHGQFAMSDDGGVVAWTQLDDWIPQNLVHDLGDGTTRQVAADPAVGTSTTESVVLSNDGSVVYLAASDRISAHAVGSGGIELLADAATTFAPEECDCWGYRIRSAAYGDGGNSVVFLLEISGLLAGQDPDDEVQDHYRVVVGHRQDTAAPSWPAGAALRVSDIGATFATVSWDAAVDDLGVTDYRLRLDGVEVARTGTDRSVVLDDLDPDTEYEAAVLPFDGSGQAGPAIGAGFRTLGAAVPGDAALRAVASADGTVSLTWDPADPTPDGYRVTRTVDGVSTIVGDVTATAYRDTAVPADSVVEYVVGSVHGDSATPHTVAAMVTTPAIPAPTVTWTPERIRGGQLELGGTVGVRATGQPHRSAVATLSGADPAGAETEIEIALTEEEPGIYTGVLGALEGMSTVTSVTADLRDDAGHEASGAVTGASVPALVSGAIRTVFDSSLPLDGATVDISRRFPQQAELREVTGTDPITVPVPAGVEHDVSLWDAQGAHWKHEGKVVATGGTVVDAGIRVQHPAMLTVTVTDAAGEPVPGVQVRATEVGGSHAVRTATVPGTGTATTTGWKEGSEVQLRLTSPSNRPMKPMTTTVALGLGENTLSLTPEFVGESVVTGTVTQESGESLGTLVGVTVTQVIEGAAITRYAEIHDDGTYSVTAFQGPATISTYSDWVGLGNRQVRSLELGATAVVDFHLDSRVAYRVEAKVNYRAPGQDWTELTQGFGNPAGLTVQSAGRYVVQAHDRWIAGASGFSGYPGQTVEVCAAYVIHACESLTLPEEPETFQVELDLDARARATVDFVTPDGQPVDPTTASIREYGATNGFSDDARTWTHDTTTSRTFDVPHAGLYVVTAQGPDSGGSMVIELADGQHLDAPPMVMYPRGPYSNARNSLAALRGSVLPGAILDLRATISPNPGEGVVDPHLEVALPAGWQLVDAASGRSFDSVEAAQDGDRVTVDLSTVSAEPIRPGEVATRIVRLAVKVADDAPTGESPPIIAEVASGADDARHYLGTAITVVEDVTLLAPEKISEPKVAVSGRAPEGTAVTIVDDDAVVGVALAGPGGQWSQTVELRERPAGSEHALRAEAEIGGTLRSSDPVWVTYDPQHVRLTGVTLDSGLAEVSFSGDGVARFPLVVDPYSPISASLSYDRSDLVSSARVTIGDSSARTEDGDVFQATVPNPYPGFGPVYIDVDSSPKPTGLDDPSLNLPETEEEALAQRPGGMHDAELVSRDEYEEAGRVVVATEFELPSLPEVSTGVPASAELTATYSQLEDYQQTPEDLELAEQTGLPILGAKSSTADDGLSGTIELWVAPEELEALGSQLQLPTDSFRATMASVLPGLIPRIPVAVKFDWILKMQPVDAATKGGSKYDKILDLLDGVDSLGGCGQDLGPLYDQVNDLQTDAYIADAWTGLYTVAGLALAPATFGIGTVAVWAIGYASDAYLGSLLDERMEALDDQLSDMAEECKRKQNERGPVAIPTYIVDPSGFVYDGVEDNRVSGVTTTIQYAPTADGPWEVWDAEWFGQENPLVTNDEGRYAWDVPVGFWRVTYEHDDYLLAHSEVLEVFPPHFDVNIGLIPRNAPTLTEVSAAGTVDISFDQYMDPDWVTPEQFRVLQDGVEVAGTITSITAGDTAEADAPAFSTSFRFTPEGPLVVGTSLEIVVLGEARNHGGRPLGEEVRRTVVVEEPAPGEPGESGERCKPGHPWENGKPGQPWENGKPGRQWACDDAG